MFQRKMSLKRALLCKKHPASHFLSKTVKDFSCSMKTASSSTCKELSNQYLEDNQTEDRENNDDLWSKLPQELLGEIIQRIESSEDRWPMRKNVVTCACVNKKWREVTQAIVKSANRREDITFPSSLKEPCPRNMPLRCLIRRNKKDSTFYLHLGLNNSLTEMGKFLLAARRFRHGARVEYIISLSADHLSQASNACIGKLTSNFLGTKFTVYDTQPPHHGAKPSLNRGSRRLASKQISPQVPASSFEVAQVSYKFNLLKSRGPRRMLCTFQCPCPVMRRESVETSKGTDPRTFNNVRSAVLVNKSPRWHENLQCWCLNFHGRVTVASVKNFQLVARIDPSQPGKIGDEDLVLLQFGKVGDDLFTMDYRQPLSAFQAFAICLTSFGAKIGCE